MPRLYFTQSRPRDSAFKHVNRELYKKGAIVPYTSSVASFLLWGGGGARSPNVPTEKKNHVHATYYARASEANERFRNIFSGLKIHLHYAYIYNHCSSH